MRNFSILRYTKEHRFEDIHVHIFRKEKRPVSAKYNLKTKEYIEVGDLNNKEQKKLEEVILDNFDFIKESLEKLKKGEKVKAIEIFKQGL